MVEVTCALMSHPLNGVFRDLEKNIIASLTNINESVIATGGGSILDINSAEVLKKNGTLIYLNTSYKILHERLKPGCKPAFLDNNQLEKNLHHHYETRKNIYKNAANIELITENKSIIDIAEEIILLLHNYAKLE